METEEHQRRVAEFQVDLRQLDAITIVRKHITTGTSAVLNDGTYYELRNEVADYFRLHPSEVVVVGSCRTGFSLKPTRRYAAFTEASDVDLAIVSRTRFDAYWDLVFDHWRAYRPWSKTRTYRVFLKELFKGWLWPRRLPPQRHFAEALAWVEFEDHLGRSRFNGLRSVGARLYRSWDRLEAYQAIHVVECKNALARQPHE
jgi:predicted nucleotidyltransferase